MLQVIVRGWPVNVKYPQVGVARWIVPVDSYELREEIIFPNLVSKQIQGAISSQRQWDGY